MVCQCYSQGVFEAPNTLLDGVAGCLRLGVTGFELLARQDRRGSENFGERGHHANRIGCELGHNAQQGSQTCRFFFVIFALPVSIFQSCFFG